MDASELVRHELVGLHATVAKAKDAGAIGLEGEVVDETRNMLTIKTASGRKALAKKDCTFVFTLPDARRVSVDGSLLVARPEDRIKKKQKSW